jgi:Protein of unknown function (DUF3037)
MPADEAFAYALLRVVPQLQRGEAVNAGVVLYCRRHNFLEIRAQVPHERLRALAPDIDLEAVAAQLATLTAIAAGDPEAGPIAAQPPSERFHWLVAPASTIIQPSAVHTGVTSDPEATLLRLFEQLVQ